MATWSQVLSDEKKLAYFQQIIQFVQQQRDSGKIIYPAQEDVFNAFKYSELDEVKVVILGQDPYHGPHQAHGLCFSVQPGIKPPPSLANIYKELAQDIAGFVIPEHGDLRYWAEQGVLLLNAVLTVEQGKAHSHAKIGWEQFTDAAIRKLSENRTGVVFLLWGNHAQQKAHLIDTTKHHILTAPHPSPLSAHRGFLGCGHFSRVNSLLQQQGLQPINWQV